VTATRPVVAMITSPGGVELVEAADNRLSMVDLAVVRLWGATDVGT